ncbi:MAG: chemotaxis protein CheW [Polyangiaceae bacterium]
MSTLTRYEGGTDLQTETTLHVVFKVGNSEYMLPFDSVLQMESFSGATQVPGAPAFVAGIVQIRGKVVPLVDLRLRFGAPPIAPTLDTRVVVGQHGDRVVGLLVDSAREVIKVPRAQIKPPPPILIQEAGGFVAGVAQLGTRVVMLVDFAKVIGEEPLDVVE